MEEIGVIVLLIGFIVDGILLKMVDSRKLLSIRLSLSFIIWFGNLLKDVVYLRQVALITDFIYINLLTLETLVPPLLLLLLLS